MHGENQPGWTEKETYITDAAIVGASQSSQSYKLVR